MKRLLKVVLAVAVSVTMASRAVAAHQPVSVFEDFRRNPLTNGWQVFGDTNLFAWNATNENLEVTWDSSKPNSYFYKRLARPLSRADDFALYFDLRMRDIAIGTTTNKPYTFQIAVGLLNFQQATNGGFLRGTGFDSPNLFEFDYFPDSGFGATISPTIISSNNEFATAFILQEITPNDVFRVIMRLNEEDENVSCAIYRNDQFYAQTGFTFPTNFSDFAVDAIAVMSYSDEGQFPDFAGSILAHGDVDNLVLSNGGVALDVGFRGRFEGADWRMTFDTLPGYSYYVERAAEPTFSIATTVGSYNSTNYGQATIVHTNALAAPAQFYRLLGTRL